MGLIEKKPMADDELEEEIYEPIEEMVKEAEEEEAKQRTSKCITRVVHPLLHLQMKQSMKIKPRKKHTTFPWQPAPHDGSEILGPPPQLNGVEFSKRRRVDAVKLTWLETSIQYNPITVNVCYS